MDMSTYDWGAIAGFLGAGATIYAAHIALLISNQWRIQKRSEIISEIANKAYKQKIICIDKTANLYHKVILKIDFNKSKYDDENIKLSMDEVSKAMDELNIAKDELITNLDIIAKFYSNKEITNTIKNLNDKKEEFYIIIIEMLIEMSNKSEIDIDQKNKFNKDLFIKSSKIYEILESHDLEKCLINYILHNNT